VADRICELFCVPPIAIARLGGSTTPLEAYQPTFAGLRLSCGQDRALDRLEQQQFALAASKARSKLPLKGTKALPCDDLDTRHRLLL
jgi:hypothetical protein